jgi:SAM-dependent methyltransferase
MRQGDAGAQAALGHDLAVLHGILVTEYSLPRSDEPFDFRHQATLYARYRRGYSAPLYDLIEARTGPAAGRLAVDLGCGTGLVGRTLRQRGWAVVGVDFSGPMLAEARRGGSLALVQGRGEVLPLRDATAALFTCGTMFHWLAPVPALAEIARVLAPGGWIAIFWRTAVPGEEPMRIVADVLGRFGSVLPEGFGADVHSPLVFGGSGLIGEPVIEIDTTLTFTAEEFHGYVATVEWIRRMAGPNHAAFLAALREELDRTRPGGLVERNREYLLLARRR